MEVCDGLINVRTRCVERITTTAGLRAASIPVAFITANRADCGWQFFNVVGHTDRSGSDKYNDSLSLRRASAIADLMRGAGIADTELRVSGRGESEPKVDTPDGERNPTNRRVEITAN